MRISDTGFNINLTIFTLALSNAPIPSSYACGRGEQCPLLTRIAVGPLHADLSVRERTVMLKRVCLKATKPKLITLYIHHKVFLSPALRLRRTTHCLCCLSLTLSPLLVMPL